MNAEHLVNAETLSRSDLQMVNRALKERWNIGEEVRDALIKKIAKIALEPHSDPRINVNAARVLMTAERMNQVDQIAAIASGLNQDVPQTTTRTPDQIVDAMDESIPRLEQTGT